MNAFQNRVRSLTSIVALLFLGTAGPRAHAQDNQFYYFTGTGHYYRLTQGTGTWHDMEAEAVAAGGHLVSITSQEEQDFVVNTFLDSSTPGGGPDETFWIGLRDVNFAAIGQDFRWTTGEPVTYTNWNNGPDGPEPNDFGGLEWYVHLNLHYPLGKGPVGSWNDTYEGDDGPHGPRYCRGIIEISNRAPVATNDFYGMDQGDSLIVSAPGILANDSDPDGDSLSVELVTGPANAASFQLNADGSFTYTPHPYFVGEESFTYRVSDGTAYSKTATVRITVSRPGSQGFITGGGKFFADGRKCTFGFVAKVQGSGVQGQMEYQDHEGDVELKSQAVQWVYSPNATDGYFSGTCSLNGEIGYTFFVQVHDRGEPGTNDDFAIWVFDSLGNIVYAAGGGLAGGNIAIHGG